MSDLSPLRVVTALIAIAALIALPFLASGATLDIANQILLATIGAIVTSNSLT